MAFDEKLAERVRAVLGADAPLTDAPLTERRMFGGLAFLVNGNMAVVVSGQGGLMVRADPRDAEGWLDGERVAPMVMRGRELAGWLRVAAPAVEGDGTLSAWVRRGIGFAETLPAKESGR